MRLFFLVVHVSTPNFLPRILLLAEIPQPIWKAKITARLNYDRIEEHRITFDDSSLEVAGSTREIGDAEIAGFVEMGMFKALFAWATAALLNWTNFQALRESGGFLLSEKWQHMQVQSAWELAMISAYLFLLNTATRQLLQKERGHCEHRTSVWTQRRSMSTNKAIQAAILDQYCTSGESEHIAQISSLVSPGTMRVFSSCAVCR